MESARQHLVTYAAVVVLSLLAWIDREAMLQRMRRSISSGVEGSRRRRATHPCGREVQVCLAPDGDGGAEDGQGS